MDTNFFRKAKKSNRAIEYTNLEAIIPAVKTTPEIRVSLPTRRLMTIEERQAVLDERYATIVALEETIMNERKELMGLVKAYSISKSGAPAIVAQNLKIKALMSQRADLAYPLRWIEEIKGLTFKDVFEGKRDVRKIGSNVYQIKHRVEPITSLYVDLGAAATDATLRTERKEAATLADTLASGAKAMTDSVAATLEAGTDTIATAAAATAAAARGAIIGQRRLIKVKKTPGPAGPP